MFQGITNEEGLFFQYVVYTRLYLALATVMHAVGIQVFLGLTISLENSILAGLGVLTAYNLNRYTDIDEDSSRFGEKTEILAKKALIIAVISFALIMGLGFGTNPSSLIPVLAFLGVLPLYSARLFPDRWRYNRLKDIPAMKNLTVGVAFAILLLGLPLSRETVPLILIVTVGIFVVLRIFISSVISDVRDISGDEEAGVMTLPVVYGMERTRLIMIFCNVMSIIVLSTWYIYTGLNRVAVLVFLSILIGTYICMKVSEINGNLMSHLIELNETVFFATMVFLGALLL